MSTDVPYPNDYLTVKEAAKEMRCCEKTVRNYIRSGVLPAKRRGPKIILISLDDISCAFIPENPRRQYR